MRIAQVSPLQESVPPKAYGGTERIVSYLTEELVNQGHEVILFASGDSKTQAHLVSPCAHSFRSNPNASDTLVYSLVMLEQVFREIDRFDIVHFHIDWLHPPHGNTPIGFYVPGDRISGLAVERSADSSGMAVCPAAEILETDLWQQYTELALGNEAFQKALGVLDEHTAVGGRGPRRDLLLGSKERVDGGHSVPASKTSSAAKSTFGP